MHEICEKGKCTGCMTCYNICTSGAIIIKADEEGFEVPFVQNDICTNCGLCKKVCPVIYPCLKEKNPLGIFSGWSKNEEIRIQSSSGGAFTEIARIILKQGGIVFGCALNQELKAEHTYVTNIEGLKKLQGSKYVQSHIGNTYKKVKEFLDAGRLVLFSGTPCQIAGLKNYLRKNYDNLFTVDLICHGVPSPLIFEEYKKHIKQKMDCEIQDIKFRNKNASWLFFNMRLTGYNEKNQKKKTYIGSYYKDPWIRGFLRDFFLRSACYQCQYTSTQRVSDFTIADWWRYRPKTKQDKRYLQKGVSLLFINTPKAENCLSELNMQLQPQTLENALKTNLPLRKPASIPELRKSFWDDYKILPFSKITDKYMYPEISWDKKICNEHPLSEFEFVLIRLYWRIVKTFKH